jgi:hypothetical protein
MNLSPLQRNGFAWRRRLGALMVAGTVVLTGCRSGGGPAGSNRPFAAYRQCLEQHGVTPRRRGANLSTTTTANPSDAAAFRAARKACRKLRPAGGLRGGELKSSARAAFRRCMTDHGVTLPNLATGAGASSTSGTGAASEASVPRGGMLAGLNRNDPTVAKALAACRPLLVASSTTTTTKH